MSRTSKSDTVFQSTWEDEHLVLYPSFINVKGTLKVRNFAVDRPFPFFPRHSILNSFWTEEEKYFVIVNVRN